MTKLMIWDWDGTLGYHVGMFSGSMETVLQRELPGTTITAADLRPHLQAGFYWDAPDRPHTEIRTAEAWWAAMEPAFERAAGAAGVETPVARRVATQVRFEYIQPHRWKLYDDTLETLQELSRRGWTQVVLSNHVPELEEIVARMPVGRYLTRVFTSGLVGYEKPHPRIYRFALDAAPGAESVWMAGDRMDADVVGPAAAGIPGILVRRFDPAAERFSESLSGVVDIVEGHTPAQTK